MNTLVIDIGNTKICTGQYSSDGQILFPKNFPTDENKEFIKQNLNQYFDIDRVAIASVVPSLNIIFSKILYDLGFKDVLWINDQVNIGAKIDYPDLKEIGADRLANTAEAFKKCKGKTSSSNIIVCDFGTALTFDVIHKKNGYIGGIICPGPNLMLNYLSDKTALLPNIKLSTYSNNIGRSTQEAILIGANKGFNGMVKEIINGIEIEIGKSKKVLTGGFASWFFETTDIEAEYDEFLTLRGIGVISELNI